MSEITIADVNQSNGVIHVVDTVVLPKINNLVLIEKSCVLQDFLKKPNSKI
jgi:DNA replication initiation complex subunit (GINS family)